uniref:Uncharacterized protein n=1 Tax=Opuntia streptacantha TaxID=393608 RepID=A0A7C8YMV1_OPUST
MTHTKNVHNTGGHKHMLADRAEPTQGTNQLTRHSRERRSPPQTVGPQTQAGGPGRAHSRYQPADPHSSKHKLKSQLVDRAEPIQPTTQQLHKLKSPLVDRAEPTQPTTQQLQTQTEEPIGRPNDPAAQTQRQPLLWPKL